MNHDELLAKIGQRYWKMFNHNSQDQTEAGIEHRTLIQNQYFVLRAVVEFHKPYESITLHCQGCDWSYPCDTIEVIEKELT